LTRYRTSEIMRSSDSHSEQGCGAVAAGQLPRENGPDGGNSQSLFIGRQTLTGGR